MLPLLTDNDFRAPIVRALRRLSPGADIVSAREIGMALAPDEELLAWAAEHGRVLLTHDARTMPPTHYRRIAEGLNPPRLILVVQSMPIGMAAEELLLVLDAATHGDWRSNYIRLPLQY